ncbi:DUF5994 family protein [Nocardia jiangsuensis]|uniref:DUF5994 family protein n=1 Tax=Nocardia jiangsuensis TaxID=1691563 RepID=A0ABV8DYN5_9NOCA
MTTPQLESISARHATRLALHPAPRPAVRSAPVRPPRPGLVDGAWWPRTLDLVAELRALAPCLVERLGAVERVTYDLAAWQPAPKRMLLDGRSVRLDGYGYGPARGTLGVLGVDRRRVLLLVIPVDAAPAIAGSLLSTAGAPPGREYTGAELTAAGLAGGLAREQAATATARWDGEGGRGAAGARAWTGG